MKSKEDAMGPRPLMDSKNLLKTSNGWVCLGVSIERMTDDAGEVWWEEKANWKWADDYKHLVEQDQ